MTESLAPPPGRASCGCPMTLPIRHLPIVQNWDCHASGACCRQGYIVSLTEEERKRIEAQGWDRDRDLGGAAPFTRSGPPWRRRWQLGEQADGSCVFLSENGRCRIHERFGYEAKPLACRLFPFVLLPAGTEWRISLRYACPSAAANLGRSLTEHDGALAAFADELVRQTGLTPQPDGALTRPPRIEGTPHVGWPDVLRIVSTLLDMLRHRTDPLERRLRKCLALSAVMRKTDLRHISGERLEDLLKLLRGTVDQATPANLMTLAPPGWIGRVLFRQSLALFTRKDNGPGRCPDGRGAIARLAAAVRFVRGTGRVPRMNAAIPETTFEEAERPGGPLPLEAESVLERYYQIKTGSLQFCGPASFGVPFWEGFETLVVTFPILLFVARTMKEVPRHKAVARALTILDDHIGFNRSLGTARQRMSFQILARTGELAKLVGWYSR
jgi:lysine-N-methylase